MTKEPVYVYSIIWSRRRFWRWNLGGKGVWHVRYTKNLHVMRSGKRFRPRMQTTISVASEMIMSISPVGCQSVPRSIAYFPTVVGILVACFLDRTLAAMLSRGPCRLQCLFWSPLAFCTNLFRHFVDAEHCG